MRQYNQPFKNLKALQKLNVFRLREACQSPSEVIVSCFLLGQIIRFGASLSCFSVFHLPPLREALCVEASAGNTALHFAAAGGRRPRRLKRSHRVLWTKDAFAWGW